MRAEPEKKALSAARCRHFKQRPPQSAEGEEVNTFPRTTQVVPHSQTGGDCLNRLKASLKLGEQDAGLLGSGFVLNHDVRPEGLAILRDKVRFELPGKLAVKRLEFGGSEAVGYPSAQRAQSSYPD
jgi:hypothetical protein